MQDRSRVAPQLRLQAAARYFPARRLISANACWMRLISPRDASLLRCVGAWRPLKNCGSHIDASHSRQPLVKGERLVRYEVNAVMLSCSGGAGSCELQRPPRCFPRVRIGRDNSKRVCSVEEERAVSKPSSCENFAQQALPNGELLPRRVRSPQLCAMPALRARAPEQAREDTSPSKN